MVERIGPQQPEPTKQQEQQQRVAQQNIRLRTLLDPSHLSILMQSAGVRFGYRVDADTSGAYTTVEGGGTGQIFFGLSLVERLSDEELQGVIYHETGHHSPAAVRFQNLMRKDIENLDRVPEAYKATEDATGRFFNAMWSGPCNVSADVFLEAYVGRQPFNMVRAAFDQLYMQSTETTERENNIQ